MSSDFSHDHEPAHPQRIADVLQLKAQPQEALLIQGWVRTRRDSSEFSFLEINDGTCLSSLQVIADAGIQGYEAIEQMSTGASVQISGQLKPSPGKNQRWELHASKLCLIGTAEANYPLQKKRHSLEFLRTIAHLRPRTNLFGAVFRTRSVIAQAVHDFFRTQHFHWLHTPILTTSDAEGAGELFRATTIAPGSNQPENEDFFGKSAYLSVSGQLEAEAFACALGQVYTFGPTFRAENSHTSRHAAEFWMIEPEAAFYDLEADMDLAEAFTRHCIEAMLEHCSEDLAFFSQFVAKGQRETLEALLNSPFQRISYTEAVALLQASGQDFEYPVSWGVNLQSEHERWLVEEHFQNTPTIVHDYPQKIKPFYMRLNDEPEAQARAGNPPEPTVAALDLLVPGVGELIGGSQREERLTHLEAAMNAAQLDLEEYDWYLDLRRHGSVPHAGFGLGFERLLMFLTGVSNIRDVLPSPRTAGQCNF